MSAIENYFRDQESDLTEFDQLWRHLVPLVGSADTIQGELVRVMGKLWNIHFGGHVRRRAPNWDDSSTQYVRFLEHLIDGSFDAETTTRIQWDLRTIEEFGQGLSVPGDPDVAYRNLMRAVIQWCQKHPVPERIKAAVAFKGQ